MKIQHIQRFHGIFLMVLALALAGYSTFAEMTGAGVYGFLQENPWGQVGLIQAYLLMSVIGFCIFTGSKSSEVNKIWNYVGIVSHTPPLIALMLYGYLFIEIDLAYMIAVSIAIHATWITIELLTLAFLGKSAQLQTQL